MPPRFGWRIAAALLPLAIGAIGLYNNLNDWRSATTFGQHIAGAGVILYGPLGVLAALAILGGHRSWRPLLVGWSAVCTLVGALSPVVWSDAAPAIGVLAGFSTALFCAASIWAGSMAFPTAPSSPTP